MFLRARLTGVLGAAVMMAGLAQLPSHAAPSAACSLDLPSRALKVADYVDDARVCLTMPPIGYTFETGMEAAFVARINDERASRGLARLTARTDLIDSARFHSLDMARNNFFGHSGPDKRIVSHRVAAFDRRALIELSAENVAMIEIVRGPYDLSREAVPRLHQNLMDSEGHRHNILNPELTDMAIGVVRTDRGVWVTQVFLDLTGTLSEPVPLRVRNGDEIRATPRLSEWTFRHYEAERDDASHTALADGARIPQNLSGDFLLTAYSERPGDTPRRRYTIRLAGPAITVQ